MIRNETSSKNSHIKSYSKYRARFASHPWHINENDKEWEFMLNFLMNTVVPCPDNFDKLPARRKRIKQSVLIVNADLSQIFISIQKFILRIPSKWYIRGKSYFGLLITFVLVFISYNPFQNKILSCLSFIIQFTFNIVLCYDATRGFYPLKYANVYSCVCKNNK